MNPLFSIITPSYNKAAYIKAMIESVFNQTEENWELIIIDDASTDGSYNILQEINNTNDKLKITFNNENKGAAYCRNYGIEQAIGKYIIFLDADDLMAAHCLEQRRSAAESNPKTDIWLFNMALFNKKIGDIPKSKNWIVPLNKNDYLSSFLKHNIPWSIMQSTWKAEYLKKMGGFDVEFKEYEDVEIHTSAILNGAKITPFSNLPVDVFYRIDETRKNYTPTELQSRIVDSSLKYYTKFFSKVNSRKEKKMLTGTLFQPLSGLCWQLRTNAISFDDYQKLKDKLINTCMINNHKSTLRNYQKISRFLPFHLPGLKKIFSFLITR